LAEYRSVDWYRRSSMVVAILLFSIVLVRLPAAFGDSPPPLVSILSLIPFFVALGALLLWKGTWRVRGLHLVLFAGYVALLVVAILRAMAYGVAYSTNSGTLALLTWVPLALLGAAAFIRERREAEVRRYVMALCWAPALYVAVNLLMFLGGFSNAGRSAADGGQLSATVLASIGFEFNRVLFPLAVGINGFGAIAGVALATTAMLFISGRGPQRVAAALGVFVSLVALLAVDSRGSLLFAIAAVLLVVLVPRARARGLAGLPLLLPLLPVLLLAVLGSLSDNTLVTQFAREGTGISTATDRSIVWGAVADFLMHFRFEQLIGYGAFGQLPSGVSTSYFQVLTGFDQPLLASAHNVVLQTVLDVGWFGLIISLALFAAVIRQLGLRHARFGRPEDGAMLAGAVCLLLIGTVDPSPTHTLQDGFTFWLLLLAAALRVVPAPALAPPAPRDEHAGAHRAAAARSRRTPATVSARAR